ncbi:MAG: NADH-quinone oxidoreductase subunit N [Acidobacteria bacterium]|nr:NADH-quinone oxidoreductase subunit N [Acidobacteriota bacterium]
MNDILSRIAADTPLILPEIILVVGATVVLFGAFFARRNVRVIAGLTLVTLVAAAIALYGVPLGKTGFFGLYRSDGFSLLFKVIVLWVGVLVVFISMDYLEARGYESAEFFALLLYSLVGMFFMASANDLLTIFVSLELMAISVYVMVGYFKDNELSNEASFKYFILGAFSSGFFIFGASLVFGAAGTTRIDLLLHRLPFLSGGMGIFAIIGVLFMLVALGFKTALFPFHQWAPDAYEGAPTPVTAFMSVAPKAAAFAIFLRIFVYAFGNVRYDWVPILSVIAVMTMIWGNFTAIRQENIKRMLAYSSIAHAGYMSLGIIAGTPMAIKSMILYLVAYSFMNIGAFAIVIILSRKDGYGEKIDDFKGLAQTQPLLAAIMLVFMLSLAGIPPTIGFFGKFYLFGAAINSGLYFLVTVALATSVVSLYYYFRVVKAMYLGDMPAKRKVKLTLSEKTAVFLTAFGTLVVGIYPTPLFDFIQSTFLR